MSDARWDIAALVHTYAERIDAGDFEGVAALFAHAEVVGGGVARRGSAEVLVMYEESTRRYDDDGTPKTKHVTTNLIVDVDEDAGRAVSRSYFTVLQAVPGALALQPIVSGRYHDEFERADGTWRFRRREMLVDLVGDLSRHLLFES